MISNELQAELDAELEAEIEVVRRRPRGEPLPAPPDPGVVAINVFVEQMLRNAATAGPDAYQIVLRVLDRTCAEINENGPYDAERVAHK